MNVRLLGIFVVLTEVLCFIAAPAMAESYPSRPIHIIVTFPPGGSADTLTRILADEMSHSLGQPVIVENKTGPGGNIGVAAAAKAAPDGYTILSSATSLPLPGVLFSKLSFDPMKDFAPITMIGSSAMIVEVNPAFPANSISELIEMAKKKPGEIVVAAGSVGSTNHLAVELFKSKTGVDIRNVPYRGSPAAIIDVLSGQVPVFFDFVLTSLPHIKSGKLKALATTGAHRLNALPEVPTMEEAGVPGYEATNWFAFFAPAGTPPDIIQKLNAHTTAALQNERIKSQLEGLGIEVDPRGPKELEAVMKSDFEKWKTVLRQAGIQPQ